MDIKDFILIGGGVLIAAVVAHGFWIAWRARRDPLRIDLVTDLPGAEDGDELKRLRAELPNGGARVRSRTEPTQRDLELGGDPADWHEPAADPLLEPDPLPEPARQHRGAAPPNRRTEPAVDADRATAAPRGKTEPRLGPAPATAPPAAPSPESAPPSAGSAAPSARSAAASAESAETRHSPLRPASGRRDGAASGRRDGAEAGRRDGASAARSDRPGDRVGNMILPERTIRADEPREPRRWPARKPTRDASARAPADAGEPQAEARSAVPRQTRVEHQTRVERPTRVEQRNPAADAPGPATEGRRPRDEGRRSRDGGSQAGVESRRARGETRGEARGSVRQGRAGGLQGATEKRKAEQPVEELIMINVIAPKGKPFVGGGVVEALRARGLRYGDMNIFHRVDPTTRETLYSVASVVEPGTFDLSDLDSFRSPGVCFFMQLPGPDSPLEVFDDMVKVARDVAMRVGGELKDEQRSVMTGQTVEHYRQRISDFCRRRMSMRA